MSDATDSADERPSSPVDERVALLEINISNRNADSQTVLNDLRLLELLCTYPFLISRQVPRRQDVDYDEWGWEQVTKAFNESYEGIQLSTPFSTEELQWRWESLRPLINSLALAKGQIPEPMWMIVVHLNNRLNAERPKRPWNSQCQDLLLSQLPFVEGLSQSQRRRLEVEVLDLIMDEERRSNYLYDEFDTKTKRTVRREYNEFFASIKVKELPPDTLQLLKMDIDSSSPSQAPTIINSNETGLVISNVFSNAEEATNCRDPPVIKIEILDEPAVEEVPPSSPIKSKDQNAREGAMTLNLAIPLESVKAFCKNVRVRLKRLDLDDYLPLASIRRSSRFTTKH